MWEPFSWGPLRLMSCQRGSSEMQAGGSTSQLTHVDFGRPQFLATWASPQDCQRVLVTWQLAFPKANGERKRDILRRKPQSFIT